LPDTMPGPTADHGAAWWIYLIQSSSPIDFGATCVLSPSRVVLSFSRRGAEREIA
jgi:hypothetical protein